MKVADAMTPRESLVTATVPGARGDVLERLQDHEFSSVPVVKETADGEVFRGLVSRERLIEEPTEDQLALLVEEVEAVATDATLADVTDLVARTGQRRIPVTESVARSAPEGVSGDEEEPRTGGDELAGIITVTDLVRAMAEGHADGDEGVGELAAASVNTVYQETPLVIAERELAYAEEAYGLVFDGEGRSTGMLTEVDIIDVVAVVEGEESTGDSIADEDDDWKWEGIKAVGSRYLPTRNVELPDGPVREFMTGSLVTVSPNTSARETAQEMIREDIEQIPVLSGDELVGIVRDTDLLEAYAEDE
jgi:IMP dehydrogenase